MSINAVSINSFFAGVVVAATGYISLFLYLPLDMSHVKVKKSIKVSHGYDNGFYVWQTVNLKLYDRIGRNIAHSTYIHETREKDNKKIENVSMVYFFVKEYCRNKGIGTKMFIETKNDIEQSFPEIDDFGFLMTPEVGKREALCNFYRKNECEIDESGHFARYQFKKKKRIFQ